ncbi:MAG: hypothetical protein ABIA04_13925 [Pseudomonadota bacterium]
MYIKKLFIQVTLIIMFFTLLGCLSSDDNNNGPSSTTQGSGDTEQEGDQTTDAVDSNSETGITDSNTSDNLSTSSTSDIVDSLTDTSGSLTLEDASYATITGSFDVDTIITRNDLASYNILTRNDLIDEGINLNNTGASSLTENSGIKLSQVASASTSNVLIIAAFAFNNFEIDTYATFTSSDSSFELELDEAALGGFLLINVYVAIEDGDSYSLYNTGSIYIDDSSPMLAFSNISQGSEFDLGELINAEADSNEQRKYYSTNTYDALIPESDEEDEAPDFTAASKVLKDYTYVAGSGEYEIEITASDINGDPIFLYVTDASSDMNISASGQEEGLGVLTFTIDTADDVEGVFYPTIVVTNEDGNLQNSMEIAIHIIPPDDIDLDNPTNLAPSGTSYSYTTPSSFPRLTTYSARKNRLMLAWDTNIGGNNFGVATGIGSLGQAIHDNIYAISPLDTGKQQGLQDIDSDGSKIAYGLILYEYGQRLVITDSDLNIEVSQDFLISEATGVLCTEDHKVTVNNNGTGIFAWGEWTNDEYCIGYADQIAYVVFDINSGEFGERQVLQIDQALPTLAHDMDISLLDDNTVGITGIVHNEQNGWITGTLENGSITNATTRYIDSVNCVETATVITDLYNGKYFVIVYRINNYAAGYWMFYRVFNSSGQSITTQGTNILEGEAIRADIYATTDAHGRILVVWGQGELEGSAHYYAQRWLPDAREIDDEPFQVSDNPGTVFHVEAAFYGNGAFAVAYLMRWDANYLKLFK